MTHPVTPHYNFSESELRVGAYDFFLVALAASLDSSTASFLCQGLSDHRGVIGSLDSSSANSFVCIMFFHIVQRRLRL